MIRQQGRAGAARMEVTRFAPSPNGPLHLGHAFSAIVAHDLAHARGGRFLLRIEDIDGARSRSELADEFRADLLTYAGTNAEARRSAPLGLHALAPATVEGATFPPGVVLCLRRKGPATRGTVNPLEPFYLVYVQDDGTIRHGFAQPKSVLSALEALCAGRSSPFEALCDAFDDETQQGSKLDRYDLLIESAVADIGRGYASRAAAGLAMGRGGKLPDAAAQARAKSDYELITWLIVRPGDGGAV